ncbi:hypothetical protein DFH27DRAFT_609283 [Peziza echinospora]|nr:hypothetical protein DFH27DRAFT_609283 [Peziza echinospora]
MASMMVSYQQCEQQQGYFRHGPNALIDGVAPLWHTIAQTHYIAATGTYTAPVNSTSSFPAATTTTTTSAYSSGNADMAACTAFEQRLAREIFDGYLTATHNHGHVPQPQPFQSRLQMASAQSGAPRCGRPENERPCQQQMSQAQRPVVTKPMMQKEGNGRTTADAPPFSRRRADSDFPGGGRLFDSMHDVSGQTFDVADDHDELAGQGENDYLNAAAAEEESGFAGLDTIASSARAMEELHMFNDHIIDSISFMNPTSRPPRNRFQAAMDAKKPQTQKRYSFRPPQTPAPPVASATPRRLRESYNVDAMDMDVDMDVANSPFSHYSDFEEEEEGQGGEVDGYWNGSETDEEEAYQTSGFELSDCEEEEEEDDSGLDDASICGDRRSRMEPSCNGYGYTHWVKDVYNPMHLGHISASGQKRRGGDTIGELGGFGAMGAGGVVGERRIREPSLSSKRRALRAASQRTGSTVTESGDLLPQAPPPPPSSSSISSPEYCAAEVSSSSSSSADNTKRVRYTPPAHAHVPPSISEDSAMQDVGISMSNYFSSSSDDAQHAHALPSSSNSQYNKYIGPFTTTPPPPPPANSAGHQWGGYIGYGYGGACTPDTDMYAELHLTPARKHVINNLMGHIDGLNI